jgi:hypothetical protein
MSSSTNIDSFKRNLDAPDVRRIIGTVSILAQIIHTEFQPDRKGGYFCLSEGTSGFPLVLFPSWLSSDNPLTERFLINAQEKARRLASHPEHLTSWESRNEGKNQYG